MPRPSSAPAQDDAEALRWRVAELEAERDALRERLAQAGLDAADVSLRHATELGSSHADTRAARAETTQVRQGAVDAAVEHAREMAVGRAALAVSEAEGQGLRVANATLVASRTALHASEARLRLVLESAIEDGIITTGLNETITGWNRGAANILGWSEAEALDCPAAMFFTPEDRATGVPETEMRTALAEGRAVDERWHLQRDGGRFWASGNMMPLHDPSGAAVGFLKIMRDRTEQRLAEERQREVATAKALLVEEAHHRVKNSLQLVQMLLHLQARAATEGSEAATQLAESAARVRTIGAMHEQLYRTMAGLDVSVGDYLRGLAEDFQEAMASTLEGRRIEVDADDPTWPAVAVPALGLVMTELVTNALKYGRGVVRVSFRQPWSEPGAGLAWLAVEDEGTLPAGFDPEASGGFGMRIVAGLLREPGARLEVDRGCTHTRFVAQLMVPTKAEVNS